MEDPVTGLAAHEKASSHLGRHEVHQNPKHDNAGHRLRQGKRHADPVAMVFLERFNERIRGWGKTGLFNARQSLKGTVPKRLTSRVRREQRMPLKELQERQLMRRGERGYHTMLAFLVLIVDRFKRQRVPRTREFMSR